MVQGNHGVKVQLKMTEQVELQASYRTFFLFCFDNSFKLYDGDGTEARDSWWECLPLG